MKYNIEKGSYYSLASICQDESPIVSAIISVDVHEKRTVLAQSLEHVLPDVLLSGAGKYSREQFLDAVNMLGASVNVGVSAGVFTLNLRSTAANFSKLLKLAEVMLLDPHIKTSELKRIKQTVVSALDNSKENSSGIAHQNLHNSFCGESDRRYSYSLNDTIAKVKLIKPDQIKTLHQSVLGQEWVASVTGEEKVIVQLEQFIKKIKKTQSEPAKLKPAHEQKVSKTRVILKDIPSKQNIDFSIGAPIPFTLHHPDHTALMFGLTVLGKWSGFAGRLMSTVREKEGLTYGIYAGLEGFSSSEQGSWRIMSFFSPEKTMQGLTSTFREVKKIYKTGVTEEEFVKFKTIIMTGQALLQDSAISLLGDLHAYHFKGFTLEEMQAHKGKVNLLTLEEVNVAVKKYLNPATLIVSGAGPTKAVKKEVEKFVKSVA